MKSGLSSYKLGFAAIFMLVIALVIVVFVQAGKTRQDTKTYNAVTAIADKLNAYTTSNGTVPETLEQAGVKNAPSTVSYTKESSTSYKFCVTYETGSSGISGSDAIANSIESNALNLNGGSSDSSMSDTILVIDSSYHKGLNCQTVDVSYGGTLPINGGGSGTVQPLGDPKQSATKAASLNAVCGQSGYTVHYSGTITSIKTLDSSTSDTNGLSSYIVTIQPSGDSPKGVQTITVTPSYSVFDSSCGGLDGGSLITGDAVAIFQGGSATSPDTIQDLSF